MSLLVNIAAKNNETDISLIEEEIQLPYSDLFGFEDWRNKLWGHAIMESLGCLMIFSLKQKGSVFAYDNDLQKLKTEFQIVLDNPDNISSAINIDLETIKHRVMNAMEAIRVAERYIDKVGVVLW